jgi:hypothetical protein
MKYFLHYIVASCLSLFAIPSSIALEPLMTDRFETEPQQRWSYVSDQVMGGVSEGRVVFKQEEGEQFAHMTGQVSTENNGGFIQLRRAIAKKTVGSATGAYLKVRGNGQQYYLHLRTAGTLLPWQYYQASFTTTAEWQVVKVPLTAFARSGNWLSKTVKPNSIRSIGIVAFGRDHSADIQIAEVGFY